MSFRDLWSSSPRRRGRQPTPQRYSRSSPPPRSVTPPGARESLKEVDRQESDAQIIEDIALRERCFILLQTTQVLHTAVLEWFRVFSLSI